LAFALAARPEAGRASGARSRPRSTICRARVSRVTASGATVGNAERNQPRRLPGQDAPGAVTGD